MPSTRTAAPTAPERLENGCTKNILNLTLSPTYFFPFFFLRELLKLLLGSPSYFCMKYPSEKKKKGKQREGERRRGLVVLSRHRRTFWKFMSLTEVYLSLINSCAGDKVVITITLGLSAYSRFVAVLLCDNMHRAFASRCCSSLTKKQNKKTLKPGI